MGERFPFWSDNFDADLLKVVPGVEEAVGSKADVKLFTYCTATWEGRINLPNCWNTYEGSTAYFWFADPKHERDEHGWVNFGDDIPNTTKSEIVECTWLELLRDVWVHDFRVVIGDMTVIRASLFRADMFALMWDVRKVHPLSDEERSEIRKRVLASIRAATALMADEFCITAGF